MNRRIFSRFGLLALAAAPVLDVKAAGAAEPKPHRMVIHVGGGSPTEMNVALGDAVNAFVLYAERRQTLSVEIVANGPGYAMMRAGVSPVAARIAEIHAKYPAMVFSACQNSRRSVAKAEGKTVNQIEELPGVSDVPAGIVRLSELQEQGWSYIRA